LAHPHLGLANPLVHGCLEKGDGGGGSRPLGGGERRECGIFKYWVFFLSKPLQFFDVRDVPLPFGYSEICHWNSWTH
jgi:hypothetical protein